MFANKSDESGDQEEVLKAIIKHVVDVSREESTARCAIDLFHLIRDSLRRSRRRARRKSFNFLFQVAN
jgi:hypothetical protein